MFLDQPLQPFLENVGVDLRRRDVGVAQQLLHRPQIGAAIDQVAGERMPQHMRAYPLRIEPGGDRQLLQLLAEPLAGQVAAVAVRGEQPGRRLLRARRGPLASALA